MLADAKLAVVKPETVIALEERARPEPVMSEIQSPATFNEPTYWLPVVVAFPTTVLDAVESTPLVKRSVVEVPA